MRRIEWKTSPQVRIAYDATRKSLPALPELDALDSATRDLVTQMWERGMMFGLLQASTTKTER
jgi:hypothetical protein